MNSPERAPARRAFLPQNLDPDLSLQPFLREKDLTIMKRKMLLRSSKRPIGGSQARLHHIDAVALVRRLTTQNWMR